MSILIIGCGYLGKRVATRFHADGRQVFATTRNAQTASQFAKSGWSPLIFDVAHPGDNNDVLPPARTVLFAVGFDRSSGDSIEEVYVNGLANTLERLSPETERLIYISSTGVFGQSNGELVNEQSPTKPQRPGGKACLQAEELLRNSEFAERTVILRLAGIYGPKRLPHLKAIRENQTIEADANGWLNLIHVDDAVEIVRLSESNKIEPDLLLVSDGTPVMRGDYFAEIARQLAAPLPRLQSPDPSDQHRRSGAGKQIDTSHLMSSLVPQFAFPTYREGIADTLANE